MTCSQCWATIADDLKKCPRCGAQVTSEAPSILGMLKAYPWLGVLLALSSMLTLWLLTRSSAPPSIPPEAIEPAIEPVAAPEPEPQPETETAPPVFPTPDPAPAPVAPAEPVAPQPQRRQDEPLRESPDGTWRGGPAISPP